MAIVFRRGNKRIVLRLGKRNAVVFYFHTCNRCHRKAFHRVGFVDIGYYGQCNFIFSPVSTLGCQVKNKFGFTYGDFCRYAVCNRILAIVFGCGNKRVVLRLTKRNAVVFYFHACNRCYLEAFHRVGFVNVGHYGQRNFILAGVSALSCQVKNKFGFGYRNFCRYAVRNRIQAIVFRRGNKRIVLRLGKRNAVVFYFHTCNGCQRKAVKWIGFVNIWHYGQCNFIFSLVATLGCQVKNKFVFTYRNFCRYAVCNRILAIVFGCGNKRVVLRLTKRNTVVFYFHTRNGCHRKAFHRVGFVRRRASAQTQR